MKKVVKIFIFLLISINAHTQSPVIVSMVSGCFDPAVTVPFVSTIAGKPGYDTATGNYGGVSPAQVSIIWNTSPPFWLINISGGTTVYINAADTPLPPATGWVEFSALGSCTPGSTPPTLSGGVSSTLPVSLINFSARKMNKEVALLWATSVELNNDYFSIERSTNGKTFEAIGTLAGMGTTNESQQYKFVDKRPENGINYYRLRQVDFDGSEELHKVVSVMIDTGNGNIRIYPNPASNSVQLTLNNAIQTKVIIKLFDINGRLVYQSIMEPNRIRVEMDVSTLAKGIYALQLQRDGDIESHRFVKN